MGITKSSVGKNAVDSVFEIRKQSAEDSVIALAGNPNVGKSTVFNALTGMNQHTGNWPGKTVANAQGYFKSGANSYVMVDIPGTYSLMAHSAEEEVARDFICFGKPDTVIVVCDATCLERSMNLVLQTMEITEKVIVCINLMDEAKRRGISIDTALLSRRLGVPVVGVTARRKRSLVPLIEALDNFSVSKAYSVRYSEPIEDAISLIEPAVADLQNRINSRWLSLRLLDSDIQLKNEIINRLGHGFFDNPDLCIAMSKAKAVLDKSGISADEIGDIIAQNLVDEAHEICSGAVTGGGEYGKRDRRLDKIITGRLTGFPVMLLLLALIFWLTVNGANYPSQLLSDLLFGIQDKLSALFFSLGAPQWLHDSLVLGVYRVLAWVVAVMLPPMAIFFPLFTLLEDSGFLPRIAYNLDKPFRLCNACGKQALTACMGFGCNAAGVIGCRIIDSPRERLLAILTNSFVPCNGKFSGLILIITLFFVGSAGGMLSSALSALILTAVIVLGVSATFLATKLLSETVLKGIPSSFTLELPPYRKPQIAKTLVRSVFDRTLFVLGRAAAVAAPAGLIIWLAANISIGNLTLLEHCAAFLDPFARLIGLDGVILMAFILGFPANEIVIPIIIMAYSAMGTLPELGGAAEIQTLLAANGWSAATAVCFILFSLMHWPCSTTLITVKKETGSLKYTLLAAVLPTAMGLALCAIASEVMRVIDFC
ncbi:MAG: ferrous iron transport protein B [Clostridia bacterium]|nr:ferrous iron transport protein B [Clostridia bacterium]